MRGARRELGVLAEHVAPEVRVVRRGRRKLVAVRELERWLEDSGELALDAGRVPGYAAGSGVARHRVEPTARGAGQPRANGRAR